MTLTQLISIFRARWPVIILSAVLMLIAGTLLSLILPKSYKSTSAVIVNYKYVDPISGMSVPAQLMPGYMATQVDIIGSKSLALEVVDKLQLTQNQALVSLFNNASEVNDATELRENLADYLLKGLVVAPSRDSNIIEITFKDRTPELTSTIANAFSEAFIKKSVELTAAPSRNAASFYTGQLESLKKNLEVANQAFADYQKQNNIVNMDGSLDVETARMNDLSQQLVMAQSQLMETRSRQNDVLLRSADSPDIASNSSVQNLKAQLTTAEAKLAELSAIYEKNHPEFIAAEIQISEIKKALSSQIKSASKTVSGNTSIFSQREAEIRRALAAQKQNVLNLNEKRSKLRILEQAVTAAQEAYNTASEKFTQSNFEGKSDQSNITILNKAATPKVASFPNTKLFMLASIMLGLLLGTCWVLGSELLNHRIRSVEDLEQILDMPSFGEYPKIGMTNSKEIFLNTLLLK